MLTGILIESWDTGSREYLLNNGAKVITEYARYYGTIVTRIEESDGTVWHWSDSLGTLPDWAIAGGAAVNGNEIVVPFWQTVKEGND